MPYITGEAAGHLDLLDKLRQFVCGHGLVDGITFSGAGAGTLGPNSGDPFTVGRPGAPTETWTVECTQAYDGGTETPAEFSVTGSVSGAQDPATAGEDYDNGFVGFLIEDVEGDRFQVGDTFTIEIVEAPMAEAGQQWQQLRWRENPADEGEWEWIARGPGLDGNQEIFVGVRSFSSVSGDYYNLEIRGYTGFVESDAWENQPGASPSSSILLFQSGIPFWFVANGRRFYGAARVSTIYASWYGGFFLPYATPNQYPYPITVGGMYAGRANVRWSNETTSHRFPWRGPHGASGNRLLVRFIDGSWNQYSVFPWGGGSTYRPLNQDQDYAVYPLVLYNNDNIFGEMDGVFHVTGFANSVEDIIPRNGVDHVMIQDVFRTGFNDYVALALE